MKTYRDGDENDPYYNQKQKQVLVEVICDVCHESCLDDHEMNFEHAELTAHWGYASRKDLEAHEIDICEDCYDIIISVLKIKPKITHYL